MFCVFDSRLHDLRYLDVRRLTFLALILLTIGPTAAQEFRSVQTLTGITHGRSQAGDFDGDGDLDLLLSGDSAAYSGAVRVYENRGGKFTEVQTEIFGGQAERAAWADYDGDGYLDIVATAWIPDGTGSPYTTALFRFERGTRQWERVNSVVFKGFKSPLLSWADVDGDGDPDLLIAGLARIAPEFTYKPAVRFYRNNGDGTFTDVPDHGITPVWGARADWADVDGDGDLDLALCGNTGDENGYEMPWSPTTHVYLYDKAKGRFQKGHTLRGVFDGSVAFGDVTGDGKIDLFVMGDSSTSSPRGGSFLYRNSGTAFEPVPVRLPGLRSGTARFADLDGDGWQDLIACGINALGKGYTLFARNLGGHLIDAETDLPELSYGEVIPFDFDGDGRLDLLHMGMEVWPKYISRLYRNVGGVFRESPQSLPALTGAFAGLADLDNDGDLDLVLSGSDAGYAGQLRVYRNASGAYTEWKGLGLPAAYAGKVHFGDWNRNGRVDLLLPTVLTGGNQVPQVRIYQQNNSGKFVDAKVSLPPMRVRDASWADIDNDGDLDLLVNGSTNHYISDTNFCRLYRNEGGRLVLMQEWLHWETAHHDWADIDGDGYVDLVMTGKHSVSYQAWDTIGIAKIYRNESGERLVDIRAPLLQVEGYSAAWGDYDGDGDPDLFLSGFDTRNNGDSCLIYRNNGGRFERAPINLLDYGVKEARWLDYDNDGDLDLLTAGGSFFMGGGRQFLTVLYRNDGGRFSDIVAPFAPVDEPGLAVGDVDGDGDLEVVLAGRLESTFGPFAKMYRNDLVVPNALPSPPSDLAVQLGRSGARLTWSSAADVETGVSAMSYNVRLGTVPGRGDIWSPSSAPVNGRRRLVGGGNAGTALSLPMMGLAPGTYYWSVQSVDRQFAGSPFAAERSFVIGQPRVSGLSGTVGNASVALRWGAVPPTWFGHYEIRISHPGAAPHRRDTVRAAADTARVIQGLANDTTYVFRIAAVDQGGNEGQASDSILLRPDGTPPATPAGFIASAADRALHLSWTPNSEADFLRYEFYLVNPGNTLTLVDSLADRAANLKVLSGLTNGTTYTFVLAARDSVGNRSAFTPAHSAIPDFTIGFTDASLDFGTVSLRGAWDSVLTVQNSSGLEVAIDSLRFDHPAFSSSWSAFRIDPGAVAHIPLRFGPPDASGGDYSGRLLVHYGRGKTLTATLRGRATGRPHCAILELTPGSAVWDTSRSIAFVAAANDSDNAGNGDPIRSYVWSSDLGSKRFPDQAAFSLRVSELGIGRHTIGLRVVDNEGDTSSECTRPLHISGRPPVVRLDSLHPKGLVVRGGDDLRFRFTAMDDDEQATPERDGLRSFGFYSTHQGLLSTERTGMLPSSALQLGLHGLYARAVDEEGDSTTSDTVWMPVQAGTGRAVLVAGTAFEEHRYFFQNIAPNCNWAYARLLQRGFTHEQIHYFNPVGWQSIGNPYENSGIVDETRVTLQSFKAHLRSLKADAERGVPILIALIGHGSAAQQRGRFFLNPEESLSPDSLHAWLADFRIPPGSPSPITFILDFCYSGTFLEALRANDQPRVVLASSSPDRQSFFHQGQSFSYHLFEQVQAGRNLASAFAAASQWSWNSAPGPLSRPLPLANADNDGAFNEEVDDLAALQSVYLGGSQQFQAPPGRWARLELGFDAKAGAIVIRARSDAPAQLEGAWYTVVPPDFQPEAQSGKPLPGGALALSDSLFEAQHSLVDAVAGNYLVTVHGVSDGEALFPRSEILNVSPTLAAEARIAAHRFSIGPNSPNPFKDVTRFTVETRVAGALSLRILDATGRTVRILDRGIRPAGRKDYLWDGRDEGGRALGAGVYTLFLTAPEGSLSRRLVLNR